MLVIISCNNNKQNSGSLTIVNSDSVKEDMQDGWDISTQRKIYIDSIQPNMDTGRKSKSEDQNEFTKEALKIELQKSPDIKNKSYSKYMLISSG